MSTDKSNNPPNTDNPLLDEIEELSNELANYWYEERKYTANGRWQECKDEASRQTQALILKERKAELEKLNMYYLQHDGEGEHQLAGQFDRRIADLDHQIKLIEEK